MQILAKHSNEKNSFVSVILCIIYYKPERLTDGHISMNNNNWLIEIVREVIRDILEQV